jgi:hypothetical protein
MILRRVIAHFRKQEWTAISLDFVIVVVGVFVGLQVNNWNEARSDQAQLDQQLISLRSELEENRIHFGAFRAELVQQMEDVAELRSAIQQDVLSITPEVVNAKFLNIQRIKVFSPDLTALTELAETGGLRRLSGADIRKAIGEWERKLANVERNYSDALKQRDGVFIPYMMQNIAYGPLLEQSYIVGDAIGRSKFRNDVKALAESRELDNQLSYRYGITGSTVYALDRLETETARLIDLLKKREGAR